MFRAGYIQKQGTGIAEMMRKCREKGLPEPEFKLMIRDVLVTIRRDMFTDDMLKKMGLNERQIEVVKFVKLNGKITNAEYRETCHVTDRTALRDLADLCKKHVFGKKGKTGRNTEYFLTRHKPDTKK